MKEGRYRDNPLLTTRQRDVGAADHTHTRPAAPWWVGGREQTTQGPNGNTSAVFQEIIPLIDLQATAAPSCTDKTLEVSLLDGF